MSLIGPLLRQALTRPRSVAVIDDRRSMTYLQLVGGAYHIRKAIVAATGRPHVGLMLPTSGAFPAAILGTWLAKRTPIPLNYLLSGDELAYVIADSEVDTIVTSRELLEAVPAAASIPDSVKTLCLEDVSFKGLPPLRLPPRPGSDDVAVILYTSGTTGRPKGVMLTHRNLASDVEGISEHIKPTEAHVFLGVLPQFHSFGLTALTLWPLTKGSKVVYTARFNPRKIVQLIKKHEPDTYFAVPSMFGALLSTKGLTKEALAPIKLAVSGGEPLSGAVADRYRDELGLELLEGYGLTETSPVASVNVPGRSRAGSVGRTLPGVDALIVDDAGKLLDADQEGEILIHGPIVMKGYFKLTEQTAEVMTEVDHPTRGKLKAFRTGDIGKLDADGYLYITGRKKEMLIIGGENVFPREIEEVLNRHPAVHDSAVIGRLDETRGEVPIAFIELEEGADFDEGDIRAHCRESLAQFKVPREVRVTEALPRSPTGKVLRRKLSADG